MAEKLEDVLKQSELNGELFDRLHAAVLGGKNQVVHNVVSQAFTLDDGWILTLDSAIHSLENIIRNPRKFIIDEELIVDVERAKKTNAKTIRHLASNTKYIQNVSDSGEVRPKKLLTTEMQEDLAIYENRFVCSLVQRLVAFVEQRYNDIKNKAEMYDITTVKMSSDFIYGDTKMYCDVTLRANEPPHDTVMVERHEELLGKVENIRLRLRAMQNTAFIKSLTNKKPVHPPIQKTNLIKMNVDYNNCYKLWLYISAYTNVGYSVEVKDKNLPIAGDYYSDLAVITALSSAALFHNHSLHQDEYDEIDFRVPKKKNYKVIKNYQPEIKFAGMGNDNVDDAVNEYYYQKIKEIMTEGKTPKGNDQSLYLTFARFFRSLAKIDNEMYQEIIESQIEEKRPEFSKAKTAIQKKEMAVKEQTMRVRRLNQLSRLKREDLEKSLTYEAKELLKLDKLKEDLDRERGKRINKMMRERNQKKRLAKIEEQKKLAEQRVVDFNNEQSAIRFAKMEEKRKKKEEAKRRKDLKKLAELQAKYADLPHDEHNNIFIKKSDLFYEDEDGFNDIYLDEDFSE